MLHPSYVDLMKVVNSNSTEEEPIVQSRYSIVIATAKRAREIIADEDLVEELPVGKKPLSVAVEELNEGKVKIVTGLQEEDGVSDLQEGSAEDTASARIYYTGSFDVEDSEEEEDSERDEYNGTFEEDDFEKEESDENVSEEDDEETEE